MTEFKAAHAAGDDWKSACLAVLENLGRLGPQFTLGFVYVSESIGGDFSQIHEALRAGAGIQDWVGAVGFGVCGLTPGANAAMGQGPEGGEYFDQAAIAILVTDLPREDYRIFQIGSDGLAGFHAEHDSWITEAQPPLVVVHGDSRDPRAPDLIAGLAEDCGTFLVGGLAAFTSPRSLLAGTVTGGGISGVMLSSRVAVVSGLSQGSAPLGPVHHVTSAHGNVLITLDGQPALEALKQDIGFESESEFLRLAALVNIALLLPGSDTGDFVVRNLTGIDSKRGYVAVGDRVEPGGRIMFCSRDHDTAVKDLRRVVANTAERAGSAGKGALYFSCVARGPNLFGPNAEEVRLLFEGLGSIPLAGFYANGEISNNKLYGHTGVLVVFG